MSIKHGKRHKFRREDIRIQIYELNVIISGSKFNGKNIVETITIFF